MEQLNGYLGKHGFVTLVFALAALLGLALLAARRRRGRWPLSLLLSAAAVLLVGLGGSFVSSWWGQALCLTALAVFAVKVATLLATGYWFAPVAYAAAAFLCLGLGGAVNAGVNGGLVEFSRLLASLRPVRPAWLVLLVLVQVVILLSYRSLGLELLPKKERFSLRKHPGRFVLAAVLLVLAGPVPAVFALVCRSSLGGPEFARRALAVGLRCAVVVFLTLALADLRISHPDDAVTTLFLLDRSLSIPEEYDVEAPQSPMDRRWERIKRFINDSVQGRGAGHERDKAGVIVFGRQPRLELHPSDAPRLNFNKVDSPLDSGATDIGAAIKLALASFPEGTGKRIVVLSDGNENLGNAEEQARLAKLNGVQIDVVPLAAGERKENEVLVQSIETVSQVEESSTILVRVQLRNFNPKPVVGKLSLLQTSEGKSTLVADPPPRVRLEPGLNSVPFRQRLGRQRQSYTYQAIFEPEGVEVAANQVRVGLPGDRWQNNRANTHVVALGQRRILFVEEPAPGGAAGSRHELWLQQLRAAGKTKFRIDVLSVDRLPQDKDSLGVFLSNYDCLVLADVAADWLTDEQQEMIRSNTHDQGCGLIMIGGPQAYGAGGWQGTPVEKALPVDCDIKSRQVEGKGGLVLIMHASEMADGNRWQKEIAKLAIRKLSSNDEVGVLYFDWGTAKWQVPLAPIGDDSNRQSIMSKVDKMQPGDMPDFDPHLKAAHEALIEPARGLATKHVIIISDGDPQLADQKRLPAMRADRVSVTTVGVATHGAAEDTKMKLMAQVTGGRFHSVKDPRQLPAIYIKEVRLVSRSFVAENRFQPLFKPYPGGPLESLPEQLPPLYGFVRTTAKTSLLVETPIVAPGDQRFPVLAYWQYGLGRSVAFTSDARSLPPGRAFWDRDWAGSEMYAKFWEQIVDWALRPVESGKLAIYTQLRDGKVRVTVDTRESPRALEAGDVRLEGTLTAPSSKATEARSLRFERKSTDLYEAEFRADEAGSFFLNAHLKRRVKAAQGGQEVWKDELLDSVRAGVTVPYALEFADMESNAPLLEKLREITGGQSYKDDDPSLAEAARTGAVFRRGVSRPPNLQPVWHWLLVLAAVCLFFDVAARRIAVDPAEAAAAGRRLWERLRGRGVAPTATQEFFERLQNRKAQVGEVLVKTRAAKRFDAGEAGPAAPPAAAVAGGAVPTTPPPRRPTPAPGVAPDKPAEQPEDYASRLLKAKKRVWEDREEKPE